MYKDGPASHALTRDASDGDERVVLLLNILQQDQRLVFPIQSVRKLG